jgi:hypothetical protein
MSAPVSHELVELGAGCLHTQPHLLQERNLSVQAISWVIEKSRHKGNSFVVLLMIANHAKSDGSGAWPSIKTLSKESRISERTVQRTIRRLTRYQHGFHSELTIDKGKGPHGCNLYSIPGVKLSPVGCQTVAQGVSDTVTGGVSLVSPEPSFNRPSKKERAQTRSAVPSGSQSKSKTENFKPHELGAMIRDLAQKRAM